MMQCEEIKGFCPSKDNFLFNISTLTLMAKLRTIYFFRFFPNKGLIHSFIHLFVHSFI